MIGDKKAPSKDYVELNVAEAQQDDVDKGIVRIDSQIMKDIGLNQGDIVEIQGERKTVSIAGRAFPADLGLNIIRMDPLARRNAKTSIGEKVKIKRLEFTPAKSVTLAPVKGIRLQGDFSRLKQGIIGRVVSKGDLISMGGTRRRRTAFSGSPFEEIFNMMNDDMSMTGGFGFGGLKMVVVNTHPKEPSVITEDTHVDWKSTPVELKDESIPEIAYEDIGGLEEEIKKVREMIELPMKHPEIFTRLGVSPPKGVLLYGPPGTGKTLLAKAVAHESQANFVTLNGPEIMSKFVGEAEKKLRQLFEDASKNAPSIIFIDELDAIAPKREESYGEVERRVVAQLLASMDGMKGRGKVIVIAATNRPDALDPALRRGGRFDREIEIGVPNRKGRLEILKIHTRNMPLEKDVDLEKLADKTHGYVGADLEGLAKEAAMNVIRRVIPEYNFKEDEEIPEDILNKLIVKKKDFDEGFKMVQPSAMREVLVDIPNVKWDDIGGMDKVKQELKESIEWPLVNAQMFKQLGIKSPKGVLMYGPPGCGKTLLAKAVATESGVNFISVKGPEVINKWVGESEKAIRKIFSKARQVSPSIIFFDEIDAIASERRAMGMSSNTDAKVVNQILTEMDGMEDMKDVMVLASTNRPELIDPALMRPGRFDRHIIIPPPNLESRNEIFKVHTKNMPLGKDVIIKELAKKTENYSGADIEAVCREAAMLTLRNKEKKKFDKDMDEYIKNNKSKFKKEEWVKELVKYKKKLHVVTRKLSEEELKNVKVNKEQFDDALKEIHGSLRKAEISKYQNAVDSAKKGTKCDTAPDYMG
jgi:transitional endoplasmic reticulum ATPase